MENKLRLCEGEHFVIQNSAILTKCRSSVFCSSNILHLQKSIIWARHLFNIGSIRSNTGFVTQKSYHSLYWMTNKWLSICKHVTYFLSVFLRQNQFVVNEIVTKTRSFDELLNVSFLQNYIFHSFVTSELQPAQHSNLSWI